MQNLVAEIFLECFRAVNGIQSNLEKSSAGQSSATKHSALKFNRPAYSKSFRNKFSRNRSRTKCSPDCANKEPYLNV